MVDEMEDTEKIKRLFTHFLRKKSGKKNEKSLFFKDE